MQDTNTVTLKDSIRSQARPTWRQAEVAKPAMEGAGLGSILGREVGDHVRGWR